MRRRTTALGTLALLALLLVPARPALACSCAVSDEAEQRARADAVFVGTVTGVTDPHAGEETVSSADRLRWDVEVESVEKGEVGTRTIVASARDGASCGYDFSVGSRYRIYASATPNAALFEAGLCSGTTVVAGTAPTPDETPTSSSSTAQPTPDDRSQDPPDELPGTGAPLVVVAAVGLGLSVIGAALRRRRA